MPKKIVLLLDGTSNTISERRTNVLRLYGCLRKTDRQIVYYSPGVGTMGAQNAWSESVQQISELWGMASGQGIDKNVKQAYRFLVETYSNGKDRGEARDQIYIFGFSRGAYTARMLAGFIHTVGLIERRNLNLVDYAYRAYKKIGENENPDVFAEVRLYERIFDTDRPPVRLLGLFDTVASVIEPGDGLVPQLKRHAYTSRNPSVEAVRHAVALDERRRMFRAIRWPEAQSYLGNPFQKDQGVLQDAKEVWFTGVHGDIGGGYTEATSHLAKIPLIWMIEESAQMGLEFVTQTINRIVRGTKEGDKYVRPDAHVSEQDSMTTGWSVLEQIPLPTWKAEGRMQLRRTRGGAPRCT